MHMNKQTYTVKKQKKGEFPSYLTGKFSEKLISIWMEAQRRPTMCCWYVSWCYFLLPMASNIASNIIQWTLPMLRSSFSGINNIIVFHHNKNGVDCKETHLLWHIYRLPCSTNIIHHIEFLLGVLGSDAIIILWDGNSCLLMLDYRNGINISFFHQL